MGPLVAGVIVVGVLGYVSHREAKKLEAEAKELRRLREESSLSEDETSSNAEGYAYHQQ